MQYRSYYNMPFEETVVSDYRTKGKWNETVVNDFVLHPVPKYAWSF